MEHRITDDLERLKSALPTYIVDALERAGSPDDLIEVIMDLGRVPTARFKDGVEKVLDKREIAREDIDEVVQKIGTFDADNRAGLERTLHRISAIRNRRSDIVGLTCRIGRAVYGTIDILQDMIDSGQNVLILGSPGVGKTTILRESARVLAETRRVVIVDTSNEIGGDGDVPHPAVGRARRMQVAQPMLQHEVMIEAVENHNPEVIVIDEIGRELEAQAARTIAERGVQLIGTAHGQTLDNLLLNPTLSDLVGGIESVTLSDEEARRRGTQKLVLERRSPPTFDVLIELQTRNRLVVHEDVAASVDSRLRGRPMALEMRYRDEDGDIHTERITPAMMLNGRDGARQVDTFGSYNTGFGQGSGMQPERSERGARRERTEQRENGRDQANGQASPAREARLDRTSRAAAERDERASFSSVRLLAGAPRPDDTETENGTRPNMPTLRVHTFGVARERLIQAARRLHVPVIVEEQLNDAKVLLTLKNYYRRRPKLVVDAERRGITIEVLRANTVTQMEDFLIRMFGLNPDYDGDSTPD